MQCFGQDQSQRRIGVPERRPEIISECRDCCSIGIPLDGIKDGVGPIVALLLEVRSAFVLGEFVRGVRFSRPGISPALSRR
jgi:hypothetical protein